MCTLSVTGKVFSSALSLDGTRIVTGSSDSLVTIWDAATLAEVNSFLEVR